MVPKVVHVTWFYSKEKLTFRFHMFISLLSAYKYIQPSAIMFWYNNEPTGYWWSEILRRVPVIKMCHREAPTSIYGHKVSVPEHQSDIVRLEVLMKYGGIYMDLDMVILKSFDPLRVYELTMGRATRVTLANGLMVSKPNASFLRIWHNNYKTFDGTKWDKHSVRFALKLAQQYPDLVHVEQRRLQRPNWKEKEWIFGKKIYNLTENYSMHLYYRSHKIEHNQDDIKYMNSTAGNVFRYIYYGAMDPFKPNIIVPQTVHLIWLGTEVFSSRHYEKLVAIEKHVNCTQMFIWSHVPPNGDWWNRSQAMVTLKALNQLSTKLYPAEILYKYGGLYLAWDAGLGKSFTNFFYYNATLALNEKKQIKSNIMASTVGSMFFEILLKELKAINVSETVEIDENLLTRLYKDSYPHLVHLEPTLL